MPQHGDGQRRVHGLVRAGQAGEGQSDAVRAGVEYLLSTQGEDGNWREELFTGTGFPKVFYLKYHLYRLYFPLMALARYARATGREEALGQGQTIYRFAIDKSKEPLCDSR